MVSALLSITAGAAPGQEPWVLLAPAPGGGQQHPAARIPLRKRENLFFPPQTIHLQHTSQSGSLGMEHNSSKSPTWTPNSASRGYLSYLAAMASLQEHQGSTAASSRGVPSPASPPATPRDKHRHNSMLTQSHYPVTMPRFCPWALIPHQATHLETWNSFPEIRHWGWGGRDHPQLSLSPLQAEEGSSQSVTSAEHCLTLCPTTSSTGMPAPRGASRPPKGGFASKETSLSLPGGCVLAQVIQPSC